MSPFDADGNVPTEDVHVYVQLSFLAIVNCATCLSAFIFCICREDFFVPDTIEKLSRLGVPFAEMEKRGIRWINLNN